ncbi:MAG: LysM peptidoglycan-binding domain-containing protein [Anaerolineae bacterium]|jgi:nucleoid-associated protein YgaU|nr:LysM peptidoglycan-binding domain-containing protein [Anaerolineae bacterium]
MALVKLIILVESKVTFIPLPIPLQFNPTDISISKNTDWKPYPVHQKDTEDLQFTHGKSATLTLKLFFDTYEFGTDVRLMTAPIQLLTTVNSSLHRPPICQLIWGIGLFFQGVLTSVNTNYTLFLETGTPVRAELNCTFTEWIDDTESSMMANLMSSDIHKVHTVAYGDTLSSISTLHYEKPIYWRLIAEANGIDNPRQLKPGQVLRIPILKGSDR